MPQKVRAWLETRERKAIRFQPPILKSHTQLWSTRCKRQNFFVNFSIYIFTKNRQSSVSKGSLMKLRWQRLLVHLQIPLLYVKIFRSGFIHEFLTIATAEMRNLEKSGNFDHRQIEIWIQGIVAPQVPLSYPKPRDSKVVIKKVCYRNTTNVQKIDFKISVFWSLHFVECQKPKRVVVGVKWL